MTTINASGSTNLTLTLAISSTQTSETSTTPPVGPADSPVGGSSSTTTPTTAPPGSLSSSEITPTTAPPNPLSSSLAATDTATPSSTSAAYQKGDGISGGAAAGIAIGCFIAGAIIAIVAAFLMYRRRNHKRAAAYHHSDVPYESESKSGATAFATPVPTGNKRIENFLPQPVEDAALTKELSKIRDNIKNHVQSYYHFQPVQHEILDSELASFATSTSLKNTAATGMLADISTRADAIRSFIAWALLSRCEVGKQPTLLPSEVEPMFEAVSKRSGTGSGKHTPTLLQENR
jgi:hypothetical protein